MPTKLFSARRLAVSWMLGALLFAPTAFAVLPIQSWQTAGGAKVLFVENHDLPILDVAVDFPAGSGFDTRAKSGLANLTHHLLNLGAEGLPEDEISRRLADVGAVLGGRFDQDRAGLQLRTLSRERAPALDVFTRVLQTPTFPADVLEREKARAVAGLKESDTHPETVADRAFNRLLYGDHPYGLRSGGEVESVSGLTRDDLVNFYRRHYVADRAVVAIMGDVTRAEAEAIAASLVAQLPKADGALAELPMPTPPKGSETRRIAHPASQSHILMGTLGVARNDPDYFSLYVGNYSLGGGGFVSRFLREVREQRGLAYSVSSYFIPLKQPGPFEVGLQTKKDQADAALEVVQATLRRYVKEGPTAKELSEAKQNITGGFPLRIDSNRKILEYLSLIGFYNLPLTYLDDFVKNIERVTAADIQRAFARRIDPDALVTVVVGPEEARKASGR